RHQDLKNQLDQAAAMLGQAQAQHVEATQDYERAKALYATQSLIKPEFDQAQARFDSTLAGVDQTKASLHQAPLALEDADLRAPFSGYILARNIELGNLAEPGSTAFTIADTSAVKIGFGVPEYAVRLLRLGQQFSIHLQDDPKECGGRVTSIAASADEKNRVFAIEVTVPNPKSYLKSQGKRSSLLGPPVEGRRFGTGSSIEDKTKWHTKTSRTSLTAGMFQDSSSSIRTSPGCFWPE